VNRSTAIVLAATLMTLLSAAGLKESSAPVKNGEGAASGGSGLLSGGGLSTTVQPDSMPSANQRFRHELRVPLPTATPTLIPAAISGLTPGAPPSPTPPAPTGSCPSVGLFVQDEDPVAARHLASALGVRDQVLTVYANDAGGGPNTAFTFGPGSGFQLLLGVGAVTPAQATAIGDNLVAEGYSNTIIRIMWEMNGNWEPWGTQALTAAEYISIYQAAEQAFAAVPGNHFTYAWNVSAGTVEPGRAEFDTYPGNAYVSTVGIDVYNEWADYNNLAAIISFAQSHGKPLSLDEWGLYGVDDPGFIDTIASVVRNPANDVTLQAYFSYGTNDITQFPASEAEYKRDFSGC